jgi:FkbM family methyltransferase
VKEQKMLPRVSLVECNEADYLLFSTNDAISQMLYQTGQWEDYLLIISRAFLQEVSNPLVVDIGANLGSYSIPIAKDIQNIGGSVIGFEPLRIVYYQLCGNIILNRLDNYIALNKAVGDYDGEIEIPEINYHENNNIGAFSFEKKYRNYLDQEKYMMKSKSHVPIITLNNFLMYKAPSLIKIDVEGYELNVLKGSDKFLENNNYPPIIFEAWDMVWFENGKQELLNYINYLGYEISLNIRQEFVAQHPKNSVHLKFEKLSNGILNIIKER